MLLSAIEDTCGGVLGSLRSKFSLRSKDIM